MALEIRIMTPEWVNPLAAFFQILESTGDPQFHPHPFTYEFAETLGNYRGMDLYYLLVDSAKVIGYGMLRGWDVGYEVPSLGIAVHPDYRHRHLGALLMRFLHEAARARGARAVRLKVYETNEVALAIYKKLGYQFGSKIEQGQLVGVLNL